MKDRFSLGIDLGTSNCAMALTDLETDRTEVCRSPRSWQPTSWAKS